MNGVGLGVCAAGLLLASTGARACQSDPFSVHWGDTLDVHMRVRDSESCRFGFKPGRASAVASVVISQTPQHGTVKQADATHFFYSPNRGYPGPDLLKVTATGETMGNRHIWRGDTNYTYLIQVSP